MYIVYISVVIYVCVCVCSCDNISKKFIIEIAMVSPAAKAPSVPLVQHMMSGLRFSLPPLANSQKSHTQTHTPSTITDLPSKLAGFAETVAVGFLLNLRNPLQMVECTRWHHVYPLQ